MNKPFKTSFLCSRTFCEQDAGRFSTLFLFLLMCRQVFVRIAMKDSRDFFLQEFSFHQPSIFISSVTAFQVDSPKSLEFLELEI